MAHVLLPRQLARFTDGQCRLIRDAATVPALMAGLCAEFPALGQLLLDGAGRISPFVGVFVDGVQFDDADPQTAALTATSAVQLVAAVAGG